MRVSYLELVRRKEALKERVRRILGPEGYKRAKEDPHSRRRPRPCGLTIHTAVGCPNKCTYCYIQDMGFSFTQAKPYHLKGEELVLALLENRHFLPGIEGTYLVFGSISDPFLREAKPRTLEYMERISRYLGNPVQFATKAYISEELARRLSNMKLILSPLITVVTIHKWRELEPNAPDPEKRLKTIRNLRREGLYPFLFLRPLLPGINEDEIEEIIEYSKRSGAVGVVVGGFRVSHLILERLRKMGFDIEPILRRIKKRRLLGREQVSLGLRDMKMQVLNIAKEKGLKAVLTACCAMTNVLNMMGKELPCASLCFLGKMCTGDKYCGNKCALKLPEVSEEDVKAAIESELRVRVIDFKADGRIIASVRRWNGYSSFRDGIRLLSSLYRRRVEVLVE